MPRKFRHMQEYEEEIIELRAKGYTGRQICEKFGFTIKQYKNFDTRYNKKQDKLVGIAQKRKGRPPKNCVVSEKDKVAELKYILARKDAKIGVNVHLISSQC